MRDIASVIKINKESITVVPIITDACIGCESRTCGERGEPFYVTNPENLSISIGSTVKVHARIKDQIAQALFTIFLPILVAILAFFLFGKIAASLNIVKVEQFKTLSALGFLFLTSFLIMLKNRFFPPKGQSEIIEVL